MQSNEELGYLVDLIGTLRANRGHDGYEAVVFADPSKNNGEFREYQVSARTREGIFEFKGKGRSGTSEMSYLPHRKKMTIRYPGETMASVEPRDTFPVTPPVLAMFSPLELPIWGGAMDGYRVTGIAAEEGDSFRLIFAPKDDLNNLMRIGFAVIDLEKGVATTLFDNRYFYTIDKINEIPPMDLA